MLPLISAVRASIQRDSVSQRSGRAFLLTFAAIAVPPILLMLVLSLTQQPLRGDLTRSGGYAESDYGWNLPQERFAPPLVSTHYDRPFDVVVFGDSFSSNPGGQTDPGSYWTNYVAQRTGWSVVVLRHLETPIDQLLQNPIFLDAPPRLLILEAVERYLVRDFALEADWRVGSIPRTCRPELYPLPARPAFRPVNVAPVPWLRDTDPELNFDQAADYVWKAAARNVLGINFAGVIRLPLLRSDLLSSRVSDHLLIYEDDIRKAQFTTAQALDDAYCTLVGIQNHVESNGRTRFLFMAAPDKLTAYAEYLSDGEHRGLSPLMQFAGRGGLNQVDLADPLRRAIRSGTKDVYMPNDTHWSPTGHRLVGETVVRTIAREP